MVRSLSLHLQATETTGNIFLSPKKHLKVFQIIANKIVDLWYNIYPFWLTFLKKTCLSCPNPLETMGLASAAALALVHNDLASPSIL